MKCSNPCKKHNFNKKKKTTKSHYTVPNREEMPVDYPYPSQLHQREKHHLHEPQVNLKETAASMFARETMLEMQFI